MSHHPAFRSRASRLFPPRPMRRPHALLFACALAGAPAAGALAPAASPVGATAPRAAIDRAPTAPPMRLVPDTLVGDAAEAARRGAIEPYFTALDAAVREEIAGKAPKVAVRFAATSVGAHALLQRTLLERLGADGRAAIAAAHGDALAWLLADRAALGEFLGSGEIDGDRWTDAVRILAEIVAKDPTVKEDGAKEGGLARRIAIATALTFSTPVRWMADDSVIEPLPRYEAYVAWDREGVLFPTFRELSAWEMRYVVGSWSTNEDLVWARANIKDELRRRDKVGDGAHMLAYNLENKNGVSVQEGRKFYDNKPMTMAVMLEYGGVCGAISRFGSSMSQAFGVPAMPIGQPGHCAFLWQQTPHAWSINNDISGWAESGKHGGIQMNWGRLAGDRAWLVPLMQDAQSRADRFVEAEVLLAAAAIADADDRAAILAEACDACPTHFGAWHARLAAMGATSKPAKGAQWKAAIKDAGEALVRHPVAFAALVAQAEPGLLPAKPTAANRESLVRDAARALASMAKGGADAGLVAWALRDTLVRQCEALAPESRQAARALAAGEDPGQATLPERDAERLAKLCLSAALELDVAPSGPPHGAWRNAMRRVVDGVVRQPAARKDGLRAIEVVVGKLMASNRADDARWIADRIVEAAKAVKDPALEAQAAAFRGRLG
ncbi:MAG: hypothetical protein RI967_1497 [Planctomycetota bacterium]